MNTMDKINPPHYDGDMCMQLIAVVTNPLRGHMAFCVGQAIKYLWRAGSKTGESFDTDVAKAEWYLDWMLEQIDIEPRRWYAPWTWHFVVDFRFSYALRLYNDLGVTTNHEDRDEIRERLIELAPDFRSR